MSKTRQMITLLLALILVTMMSPMALAQHDEFHEDPHGEGDYSSTPLILPTIEDFAPIPAAEAEDNGKPVVESPVGVSSYFEMSDELKVFSLTPNYRFSKKFALKARLPYIVERKREYFNFNTNANDTESASGIGDIGLEGEYTHRFKSPSKLLRVQATFKLPTGDNENIEGDNEVKVPLGSGSLDMLLRGQYSQSTKKYGILASAMFRLNASGESVYQSRDGGGNVIGTQTINHTNGNEFAASAFGRYVVGNGIWLNLGTSIMMVGNGEQDEQWDGGVTTNTELVQKSTLLDLYPGISYKVGPITPYLGARIPVITSYDDDARVEERDAVFLFQLTYRPMSMVD